MTLLEPFIPDGPPLLGVLVGVPMLAFALALLLRVGVEVKEPPTWEEDDGGSTCGVNVSMGRRFLVGVWTA
jgi:hypothetical protein